MKDAGDPFATLCAALGDGDRLAAALSGPFRRALRIHPRRGTPVGWADLAPIPWAPAGRFHAATIDPASRLDYHTGCIYPQDAASQVPVRLLDPQPGEVLVDCCAAPGSKSSQIGLALGDTGLLICVDPARRRRRVLVENLARQGVTNALVTPMALEALGRHLPAAADGVLVDAPCSGHARRSHRQVQRMAQRQAGILDTAAALVRPGGRLVYSTCTLYREENEDQIAAFLARHPEWTIEPHRLPGCDADLQRSGGLRLWPHRQATEPFFACRLRRDGADRAAPPAGVLPPPMVDLPWALPDLHCWQRGERLLAATPACAECVLPAEARGIDLARIHNARITPSLWGAQALIERGTPAHAVDQATAVRLWAGAVCPVPGCPGGLLRTAAGAPLGLCASDAQGWRLSVPSRLRAEVVA